MFEVTGGQSCTPYANFDSKLPGDFTPVKEETRERILGSAQKDWLKVDAYGPGYKTL